ncbi:MAG: SDR family oxidoreductase [Gammaproteobacteria bacterium]|nr:SDR family oxidoreductase [Gammaproteobacteria bacterium]
MPTTILITGASSGFGAATARRFARDRDTRLILAGRRRDRLEALAAELKDTPCHVLILDVRDREAVFAALNGLPAEFAAIDVLVNNAGLALGLEKAPEANLDDWEQMIDTNCKGLMYVTRAVLPGMVARGRGHIVNLGSVAGTYPYPGGNAYGATKAFVEQFSLNLKADLVGTPLRVTNIEPGLAETEFSVVRFKGDADKAKAVYAGIDPLTGDDIADIVYWVASRPAHVNINRVEVMPVCQGAGAFAVHRRA